jgi:hypothetical protein
MPTGRNNMVISSPSAEYDNDHVETKRPNLDQVC